MTDHSGRMGSPWRGDNPFAHRRSLTAANRAEIVRRYNDGATIAEIAADFRCSGTLVSRTLADAQVQTRPAYRRPGRPLTKPRKDTHD